MIRWRDNILNGRWRVFQATDDYWRIHDTTTNETLTDLYLTSRLARKGAEERYLDLTYGKDSTLRYFTGANRDPGRVV